MPTFLDKKCWWWGFGRFPYLWKISLLRMFWQPSHLSYISFGNLWCQYIFFLNSAPKKNSPRLYSPQFGTFYAWQSCARWKRQMLCKNNISFSFLCQLYVASLLMTERRQIYFSWLFKLCSVPPTFLSFPFYFGQILFIFPRSNFTLFSPFVSEDFLWFRQKWLTKYLFSKDITITMHYRLRLIESVH